MATLNFKWCNWESAWIVFDFQSRNRMIFLLDCFIEAFCCLACINPRLHLCRSVCFGGTSPSPFYVVLEENGFVHIFAIILDDIVVHVLFWNSFGMEVFVGLGMLTYSAFMEKKQEPEFSSIQWQFIVGAFSLYSCQWNFEKWLKFHVARKRSCD